MEVETRSNQFGGFGTDPDQETIQFADHYNTHNPIESSLLRNGDDLDVEDPWLKTRLKSEKKKKKKNQVFLEGYVDSADDDSLSRSKSLTDDDLDELKGCLDLGFGFSYDEIPELCSTLPALELCYSMSQRFLDDQHKSPPESSPSDSETCSSAGSAPIANWKISSPGDHPEDVKARLKYWAQAVACTVRLCS